MTTEYLTPQEVADMLAISGALVRKMLRDGDLTGIKVGALWRISKDSLEAFIQQNTIVARPKAPKGQTSRDVPMRIV